MVNQLTVGLEGAQYYYGVREWEALGTSIGVAHSVGQLLISLGLQITPIVLYDNTWVENHQDVFSTDTSNPYQSYPFRAGMELERLRERLISHGLRSEILEENDFVTRGYEIIDELRGLSDHSTWRVTNNGKGTSLKNKETRVSFRVRGKKEVDDPNFPSCAVLDAAIVEAKLRKHGVAVTVIHFSYKDQQQRTRQILNLIHPESNLPVVVVYFDDQGCVVEVEAWSSSVAYIADEIRQAMI